MGQSKISTLAVSSSEYSLMTAWVRAFSEFIPISLIPAPYARPLAVDTPILKPV